MKPTLEPMDPKSPDRRRAVYLPLRPTRGWLTHLVDTMRLVALSVVLLSVLYTVWELTT